MAAKAKLAVARQKLRELNTNKGRVKQQSLGMSKKLKDAREEGRRVGELEREVAGLREDLAGARAAAAPPGGREGELFNFSRDHSKRGAPYHEVFSEVIAPAMLSTGASGARPRPSSTRRSASRRPARSAGWRWRPRRRKLKGPK